MNRLGLMVNPSECTKRSILPATMCQIENRPVHTRNAADAIWLKDFGLNIRCYFIDGLSFLCHGALDIKVIIGKLNERMQWQKSTC
jgi:hypothetical protein